MSRTYILLFISFTFFYSIKCNQIHLEIPSVSSSHIFELSSNNSHNLHRDILFGLVDGTSSSISSSILIRTNYRQIHVEHLFNLYESKNKYTQQQQQQQQIQKEPIFRSYLLTSTFNRSYPYIRVLVGSAEGSYEHLKIQSLCAVLTAVNEQNLYETETCVISPQTGYCLITMPILKMIDLTQQNQSTKKVELYIKVLNNSHSS